MLNKKKDFKVHGLVNKEDYIYRVATRFFQNFFEVFKKTNFWVYF